LELSDLQEQAASEVPLLPGMVTVGMTPEGCVLVDLEQAGSLSVEGDPDRVDAFVAGVALELSTAPWASETKLVLIGGDDRLAVGNPRVTLADDIDDVTAELKRASILGEEALGSSTSTLAARVAPGNGEGWAPGVVVVSPGVVTPEDLAGLIDVARPHRSGVVL